MFWHFPLPSFYICNLVLTVEFAEIIVYICKQTEFLVNKRLLQFISAENISQSQFAETIGVSKASVSHVLAGRNKPGVDFLLSVTKRYPDLNLDWLIAGKGKMYKHQETPAFSAQAAENAESGQERATPPEISEPEEPTLFPENEEMIEEQAIRPDSGKNGKRIKKVVVFYDDDTYKEIV